MCRTRSPRRRHFTPASIVAGGGSRSPPVLLPVLQKWGARPQPSHRRSQGRPPIPTVRVSRAEPVPESLPICPDSRAALTTLMVGRVVSRASCRRIRTGVFTHVSKVLRSCFRGRRAPKGAPCLRSLWGSPLDDTGGTSVCSFTVLVPGPSSDSRADSLVSGPRPHPSRGTQWVRPSCPARDRGYQLRVDVSTEQRHRSPVPPTLLVEVCSVGARSHPLSRSHRGRGACLGFRGHRPSAPPSARVEARLPCRWDRSCP